MKTKDLKILLSAALCFMAVHSALAQNEPYWPNNYGGVMLQGFSWNSFADTRWTNLAQLASEMDGKAVRSVRIFNAFGVEQREPVPGVNIIVIEYTDGSTATVKQLK